MDLDNIELEKLNISKELKIIYMGTPLFSATILKGLLEQYKVRVIITQPDKVSDRDGKVKFSPVKTVADEHTILVLQPEKIRTDFKEILAFEPDLIITCAYGQIIPKEILDAPRLGCINVHASLLPKLRGGAPIHRAILNGFSKTGITIMYMDEKMDSGDIITQEEIEIAYDDTVETLHDKLAILGRDLLLKTLPSIINGTNERIPQEEHLVTFGYNIKREDEHIDFSKTRKQVYNHIRGLNSHPGAYTNLDGKILKVWASRETTNNFSNYLDGQVTAIYEDGFGVKTSNGEIVLTEVQLEGKVRVSGSAFANGYKNLIGKVLG